MLISCVVVDVYCYAAEGGDFGGKFFEARVVLPRWGGEMLVVGDLEGRMRTVRARMLRPWLCASGIGRVVWCWLWESLRWRSRGDYDLGRCDDPEATAIVEESRWCM
jgi:hypothetical protein